MMAAVKDTFLSEFKAASGPKRGTCAVRKLREELDRGPLAALDEAFVDQEISIRGIQTVLMAWGFEIGRNTLTDHRRGACSCQR